MENPLDRKVLIVEDNRVNRELLSFYLRKICTSFEAENGEIAVKMASESHYDAILMDINLGPGMDGIQTTQEIRKIPGYENTAIIAVTGYNQRGDRERILAGGLSHYVAKPFDKQTILSILEEVL